MHTAQSGNAARQTAVHACAVNGKSHLLTCNSLILDINLKKLVKFKSTTNNTNDEESSNELDAYVPLNKVRKATIFKLQLIPESPNKQYNVFIRAERKADVFLGKFLRID